MTVMTVSKDTEGHRRTYAVEQLCGARLLRHSKKYEPRSVIDIERKEWLSGDVALLQPKSAPSYGTTVLVSNSNPIWKFSSTQRMDSPGLCAFQFPSLWTRKCVERSSICCDCRGEKSDLASIKKRTEKIHFFLLGRIKNLTGR